MQIKSGSKEIGDLGEISDIGSFGMLHCVATYLARGILRWHSGLFFKHREVLFIITELRSQFVHPTETVRM
jgi:hypothetical protein